MSSSNRTIAAQTLRGRQFAIAATITTALALAPTASAADFVVNTLVDENNGVGTGGVSLREAIDAANSAGGDDTITFSVTGTITLTSALPAITTNMAIDGPGAANLTISGNNLYRPFFIDSGTVVIQDLTVANGRAAGGDGANSQFCGGGGGAVGMGGALFVAASANLTVARAVLSQCTAVGGSGGGFDAGFHGGGGGGGVGGNGNTGSGSHASDALGGSGGNGGVLGGTGGSGSPNSSTIGGNGSSDGAGGGGGGSWTGWTLPGTAGGSGSFGGGGGGGGNGISGGAGGAGGFGGGGGGGGVRTTFSGGDGTAGLGGTHAGNGGNPNWSGGSLSAAGGGGAGLGGAIFVRSGGSLTATQSTFASNSASGGAGGSGAGSSVNGSPGQGKGGAIYVQSGASAALTGVTWGSGGTANTASDDVGSGADTDDVYGTVVNFPSVVSFSMLSANPTTASSVQFGVLFSESVTGVDATDFALIYDTATVPTITSVTGSGSSYTVTVNAGASDGRIALQLNDDDTIVNSGSTPLGTTGTGNGDYFDGAEYVIDHTAPTVASVATTPTIGSLTNVTSIQIDVTMSSNVTGFASGDVAVTSGGTAAVGSITVSTVSATVLRATLSGLSGSGFLNVSLVAGAVADAAGNTNADATILNTNLDTNSATVTSITPVTATPTNADNVVFTVTFGESVSGFDSPGDVTVNVTGSVTTGTPTIVAAPAMPYTVTVPDVAGDGTISLSVNAAAAIDAVGNANLAGGPSAALTIDNTPPTILAIDVATLDLGSAASASATVTFSEHVTGFDAADVTVTHNGTTSDTPTVTASSASVYEITIDNLDKSGSFTVSIAATSASDAAGNTVDSGVTSESISRKAPESPAEVEELPDAKSPDDDVIAIPETNVDGDTADADGDADLLGSATECGAGGCGVVGLSQLLLLSGLIAVQRRRRPLYHARS